MAELIIDQARKSFAGKEVLHGVSLRVEDGSFCAMLGPSGSGKTTVLQLIAGLEALDGGTITLGGRNLGDVAPERRNIGIVFQSYALFPHMTVADNVAYGLTSRRVPRAEQRERVSSMLELVGLAAMQSRKPSQLSGGQQQRVALARALVTRPDLLLLDEPLSALDRKIRGEMQEELARIHSETGLTTVMVTHDQEEALDLADQVVLLKDGAVQQDAEPHHMYQEPASEFVADFLGAQVLDGVVATEDGRTAVFLGGLEIGPIAASPVLRDGTHVRVSIAPESVSLTVEPRGHGVLRRASFQGSTVQLIAQLESGAMIRSLMLSRDAEGLVEGSRVGVSVDHRRLRLFPSR